MHIKQLWIFVVIKCFLSFAGATQQPSSVCLESHRIVVSVDKTSDFHGQLELVLGHQSKMKIPVNVGRNGVGWHLPLIEEIDVHKVPEKQEGDGKTPLGRYDLKLEFGFNQKGLSDFSYLMLNEKIECVDDVHSQYYNQIVDRTKVSQIDWSSSEKMSMIPEYIHGFLIEYPSRRELKQGSCLFVHTLANPNKGTAGCVAMSTKHILLLSQYLKETQLKSIPIFIMTRSPQCSK